MVPLAAAWHDFTFNIGVPRSDRWRNARDAPRDERARVLQPRCSPGVDGSQMIAALPVTGELLRENARSSTALD